VSQYEKTNFLEKGRGVRVEKIESGNLYQFGLRRAKRMKTFDFIQATIFHHLKDPHSKALEPDCLPPWFAITIQSPMGEGDLGNFFTHSHLPLCVSTRERGDWVPGR
jgi:hypothetical protein